MKLFVPSSSRSDGILIENLKQQLKDYLFVDSIDQADVFITIGDRLEIFNLTLEAFIKHKYIIHYYGGIKQKYLTTYDDYLRHCITILSDEQWCENRKCIRVVKKLLKSIGKKPNAKIVKANHLFDMKIDLSKVLKEPYNLVLYNPCTKIKEVFIGPNLDQSYANLPYDQLLRLIKKCERFYTNSSAGVYEAPFLIDKDKITWLGKRNRGRKC